VGREVGAVVGEEDVGREVGAVVGEEAEPRLKGFHELELLTGRPTAVGVPPRLRGVPVATGRACATGVPRTGPVGPRPAAAAAVGVCTTRPLTTLGEP
jgi:hypothetical protein